MEYWLFLTSILNIFWYRLQNTQAVSRGEPPRARNILLFSIIFIACTSSGVCKNIYSCKEKYDLCTANVSNLPNPEILFFPSSWDAHLEQKVPSLASGAICRHISAGHLNCNIWFPSDCNSACMWCQHHAGRLWHIQCWAYLCTVARVWRAQKVPSKG